MAIAELTLTPSLVAATGVGRTIPAPSLRLHYTDRVRPAPRMGGVPDSRLARRALFDPAGSAPLEYPQLLLQMAQAYGLNLISHGYPSRQNPSTARTTREVTLNETLTRWVRPRSDWAWQEDLLVIHRHHWNRIREEELPRAIYDVWLPRLRASQGLAGEEVGQFLLAVTEQQIPALRAVLQADRTLPAGLERTLPHRDAWRAWALLTDRHRAALLQGQAARWQELPPAVQQHLREGLARRRRERMEPGLPEVAGTLVLVQAATKGLEGQPARWTLVVRREPHPDVAFDLAIPLPKTP